jgi:N-acetylmuramoyl-L-alanine amidase
MIVISSGHGKYVRGASGYLDEVNEARRVVERVAQYLRRLGMGIVTFHDDVSTTQNENLHRIVDFHNAQTRDLDVSVHFNAYVETDSAMGTEVLYATQYELADRVSAAIAVAGELPDRGAKERDDLYFLNSTEAPAILIETCFVDSAYDAEAYGQCFDRICAAIALSINAKLAGSLEPVWTSFSGKCSWFGGPEDSGVAPNEGLAFFYEVSDAPHLFLPEQPPGTTGLARRLDPDEFYVACRWDYDITPKEMLADASLKAIVQSPKTGKTFLAWPADWGPHGDTDRAADISPGLMSALGIETDDEVKVIYPAAGIAAAKERT